MAAPASNDNHCQRNSLSATVQQYKTATDTLLRWLFISPNIGDPTCREIHNQIYHRYNDPNKERPSKAIRRASKLAIEKRSAVNRVFEQPDSEIPVAVKIRNEQHWHFIKLLNLLQALLIDPWQEEGSKDGRTDSAASKSRVSPMCSNNIHTQNSFAVLEEVSVDEVIDPAESTVVPQIHGGQTHPSTSNASSVPQKPNRTIENMRLSDFDDLDIIVAILEEMQQMMDHFDKITIPSITSLVDRQSPMFAVLVANVMYNHLRAQSQKMLARLEKSCIQLNILITDDLLARYGFAEAREIMEQAILQYQCRHSRAARGRSGFDNRMLADIRYTAPKEDTEGNKADMPGVYDKLIVRLLNQEGQRTEEYRHLTQTECTTQILCMNIRQEYKLRSTGQAAPHNIFIRDLQNAFNQPRVLDKLVVIFGVALFASLEGMVGPDPHVTSSVKTVLWRAIQHNSEDVAEHIKCFPVHTTTSSPGQLPEVVTPLSFTHQTEAWSSRKLDSFWELGLELIQYAVLAAGETLTVFRTPSQDRTAFELVAKLTYLQLQGAKIRTERFERLFCHLATLFFEDRPLPATIDELGQRWKEFIGTGNSVKATKLGRMRAERAIRNPALSVVHMLASNSYVVDADITTFLLKTSSEERKVASGVGALCFRPFPKYKTIPTPCDNASRAPKPELDDILSNLAVGDSSASMSLETDLRVRSLRGYDGFSILKILEPLEQVLRQQLFFGFCPLVLRALATQTLEQISLDNVFKITSDGLEMKPKLPTGFAEQALLRAERTFIGRLVEAKMPACILYPRVYVSHSSVVTESMRGLAPGPDDTKYRVCTEERARYIAEEALMVEYDNATHKMSFKQPLVVNSPTSNVVIMLL